MKIHRSPPCSQKGVAALLVSIILLIAATLMVLTVSRGSVTEQQLSANEARNRAAIAAANAGLDRAIADIQGGTIYPTSGFADALSANGPHYRVWICDPESMPNPATGADVPQCPATSTNGTPTGCAPPVDAGLLKPLPVVYSCGWSDDNAARHLVIQSVTRTVPLASPPTNPLITRASVNVSGSATIVNSYNNLTIWSGTSVTSVGNSGKTFIRNPTSAPPRIEDNGLLTPPPPPPNSCQSTTNYVCTTDKNVIGPDVVANDPNLGQLTNADLFKSFFGVTEEAFKDTFVTYETTGADIDSIMPKAGETIWVDGSPDNLAGGTIGTRENPVILVIDGNVAANLNVTVYGLVLITGNLDIAGNMTVQGAMVVGGSVAGTGSLKLIYDPETLRPRNTDLGKPTSHPGSWRDWVLGG